MSGRTVKCAAALCFAVFFATATARALPARNLEPEPGSPATAWAWMTSWTTAAWTALTSASEEPPAPAPVVEPGAGSDEGWLIDPNG